MNIEILKELGAKPSTSEERGLTLLRNTDLMVFSPGISTAGFAEIRMAKANSDRKIGINVCTEVVEFFSK